MDFNIAWAKHVLELQLDNSKNLPILMSINIHQQGTASVLATRPPRCDGAGLESGGWWTDWWHCCQGWCSLVIGVLYALREQEGSDGNDGIKSPNGKILGN